MKNKFFALDGIRGAAALFVLGRHTTDYWNFQLGHSYLAVDLFFLLSGFVIAHSYEALLESGAITVRQFIVLRLIRLYPMYAVAFGLAVGLRLSTMDQTDTFRHAFSQAIRGFLFIPRLNDSHLFPLLPVAWSLFFELLVNFIIYAAARPLLTNKRLFVIISFCFVVIACYAFNLSSIDVGSLGNVKSFAGGLFRALYGILFGLFLYRNKNFLARFLPRYLSPIAAITLICAVLCIPRLQGLDQIVDLVCISLFFPALVLAAAVPSSKEGGIFNILGIISYPVYLLHQVFGEAGKALLPQAVHNLAPWSGMALMVATVLLAWVLERYVDLPFRRVLRRRWVMPRRSIESRFTA